MAIWNTCHSPLMKVLGIREHHMPHRDTCAYFPPPRNSLSELFRAALPGIALYCLCSSQTLSTYNVVKVFKWTGVVPLHIVFLNWNFVLLNHYYCFSGFLLLGRAVAFELIRVWVNARKIFSSMITYLLWCDKVWVSKRFDNKWWIKTLRRQYEGNWTKITPCGKAVPIGLSHFNSN